MKVSDFTYLLQHPEEVKSPVQTQQLEELLEAYPYFQAARALHLYGLKNLNSYKYNPALKYTAACTADREILFDLITSEEFLQNRIANTISGKAPLAEQEIVSEEVEPNPERDTGLVSKEADAPLPRNTEEAEQILDPGLFRSKDRTPETRSQEAREDAEESLRLGSPLEFTRSERHSFSEWLQLTNMKEHLPGEEELPKPGKSSKQGDPEIHPERAKKFEMIDRFIAQKPKIVPGETGSEEINIKQSLKLDKKELMTETLARVYLEQGKYKKAIQAYRILSLKYPEKSSFFADQIKAVEKLRSRKPE
ncbi:MAG: hypothetical protein P8Z38_11850 [Robiginitalea sp.]|jgi:hypothetical protein